MTSSRPDGRDSNALRPAFAVAGVLPHVTGSSCVEIGRSRVVCCLRGPTQLLAEHRGTRGKVLISISRSPFALAQRVASRAAETTDKHTALVLEGLLESVVALESFPQLQFEALLELVSSDATTTTTSSTSSSSSSIDDGSADTAAYATALSVALLNGNVQLQELAVGCGAALLSDGGIVVDPTGDESSRAVAICHVVVGATTGKMLSMVSKGTTDAAIAMELMERAAEGALVRGKGLREQLTASTAPTL